MVFLIIETIPYIWRENVHWYLFPRSEQFSDSELWTSRLLCLLSFETYPGADPGFWNGGWIFSTSIREIKYYFNIWGIRKKKKEGGSEKGGWKFTHFTSPGSAPDIPWIFRTFSWACLVTWRVWSNRVLAKILTISGRCEARGRGGGRWAEGAVFVG